MLGQITHQEVNELSCGEHCGYFLGAQKVNFIEKIADYVLGNRTPGQLPDIAMSGLKEGIESDSLFILAGMHKNDNAFELQAYFDRMLAEVGIDLPNKIEAAYTVIAYYLSMAVDEPSKAYDVMTQIDLEIRLSNEWIESFPELKKEVVGEELGLQHLYTWYRELQDFHDGGMLLYYNELPLHEQKRKFEDHLLEEAKNWLDLNKTSR